MVPFFLDGILPNPFSAEKESSDSRVVLYRPGTFVADSITVKHQIMKKVKKLWGYLRMAGTRVWGALGRVLDWLGFDRNSLLFRFCRGALLCCVTAFVLMTTVVGCHEFYKYYLLEKVLYPYFIEDVYSRLPLSNAVHFQSLRYRETGRVVDIRTGEVTLDGVDWVVMSPGKDSLAVFCRYGKRGYINRFTGKIAIEPVYDKAWVFADGLAAVVRGTRMLFIDPSGNVVIDRGFEPCRWGNDQVFRGGHCKVYDPVTEKVGLIDRTGNFVLDAVYDDMHFEDGYWLLYRDDRMGLFHPAKGMVYQPEHLDVFLTRSYIKVLGTDRITRMYSHDGKLLSNMVIGSVTPLEYATDQMVHDSENGSSYQLNAVAECMTYSAAANSHYELLGLMDRRGNCITPPVYTEITAIAHNRYLCQPHGLILDSSGQVVDRRQTSAE